jgi:uncharacterized protein (TIGR02300 family)
VPKPELGTKRQCQNCGAKFFDLAKDPIVCPKCGTVYQVASMPARSSARGKAAAEEEEPQVETAEAELVPLEEADAPDDEKVAAVLPDDDVEIEEEEPADVVLEEEEEDSDDVSTLIDGDIEGDEER